LCVVVGFVDGLFVRPGPVVVVRLGEPGAVVGRRSVGVGVRAAPGETGPVGVPVPLDEVVVGVAVGADGVAAGSEPPGALGTTVGSGLVSGRAAFGTGSSGVFTLGPPSRVLTSRPA